MGSRESGRAGRFQAFLNPRFVFAVYCLAAIAVTLIKLAHGPFEHSGFQYLPLQNFAIFRNSFFHLIHHQDIYTAFPAEQWDLYRYSPAFALLIGPIALLPYALGTAVWNALNAAALFWAIRWVPGPDARGRMLALWFIFLAMLNSAQNAQSNALMAALMIGAFAAREYEKPGLAALLAVAAAFIKPFGIFALLPCLMVPGRKKLIAYTALWTGVFALIPLAVVRWSELQTLYVHWYASMRAFGGVHTGISVMGFLAAWLHVTPPGAFVVGAGGIVLVAAALIGRDRTLVLASVLIFVTIFNYAAESPTYVIAVSGVALWYFSQSRTRANLALLLATLCFAMLAGTELVPRSIRQQYLEPYVVKALPCMAVWVKLQWDLVTRRPRPAARAAGAASAR